MSAVKSAAAVADLSKLVPAKYKGYTKGLVAVVGAIVGYIALHYGDSEAGASIVSLATALGVFSSSNA